MRNLPEQLPKRTLTRRQIQVRTLVSFAVLLLLFTAAWMGFNWIKKQPSDNGTPKPLRSVLNTNEKIFASLFDSTRRVKEYPLSAADKKVRVNGNAGMDGQVDMATWRLQVIRSRGDTLFLTMDDIKKLPKKDIAFDFKCIEGWSQVTHWAGVPFSRFVEAYQLKEESTMNYIGLVTPDKEYYVGIDMPSALQEQTLLCYEMNGKPLPVNQGFPLRLIIPVKYGIKHLKRIGTLFFSNTKPADYWAEKGYDYYAGH
ncbi:MAG TPA: molybdopterin-dependent oxidoreductase [Flavisolibacter sp.]|nr:molybdopterin-dependent oxidoreductase [Flavisolibacter sp.]